MQKEFERATGKTDLENREASGFWKAITLSNDIGQGDQEINLEVILSLNRCILEHAIPEAAGKLRVTGEDILPLECVEPPPGSMVREKMYQFEKDLKHKIYIVPLRCPKPNNPKHYKKWVDSVFDLAAWVQHSLVAIHPFSEGNGRTARLMTNIILRRYNFPPTDVKIESDDKAKYLNALCQIDMYTDYKPLKDLILKGALATLQKERDMKRRKQAGQ
ncbi:MAG: Fic family protein [Patescibacteria group bacterium]